MPSSAHVPASAAAAAPRLAAPMPCGKPAQRLPLPALVAYGAFGMPLAMAALPLYVHLPRFYGEHLGVGLAALGVLLLLLRVADGLLDPLLGAWSDRGPSRRALIALSAPALAVGMIALFSPTVAGEGALLAWLGVSLALVYLAFSLAAINHGAWGAELAHDPVERTRITAMREGLALLGVVVASIAPGMLGGAGGDDAGLPRFAIAFAVFTAFCLALLWRAPLAPRADARQGTIFASMAKPLADPLFRPLVAVFLANGIASAIPATLVLFFIADVLQAESRQGLFLALYFVAGAAGMPLWIRLSAAVGKVRGWAIAMLAATAAFVWAALLGPGDVTAFAIICVLSGLALGADLALPPSILADVIERRGAMQSTGAYFGVWTLVTKLNLALAAGIALPLLSALGYTPGATDAKAQDALAFVYAAVPCALKLVAVGALVWFAKRQNRG